MNFTPDQSCILVMKDAFFASDLESYSNLEHYGFNSDDIILSAQNTKEEESCLRILQKLLRLIIGKDGLALTHDKYILMTELSELESAGINRDKIVWILTQKNASSKLSKLRNLLTSIKDAQGNTLFDAQGKPITQLDFLRANGFNGDMLIRILDHLQGLQHSFSPMIDMHGQIVIENTQPLTQLSALIKKGFSSPLLLRILEQQGGATNFTALLTLFTPIRGANSELVPGPNNQPATRLDLLSEVGFSVGMITSFLSQSGGSINLDSLWSLFMPLKNSLGELLLDAQHQVRIPFHELVPVGFDPAKIAQIVSQKGGSHNLNALVAMVSKNKEIANFIQNYPNASTIIADLGSRGSRFASIEFLHSILINKEFRNYILTNDALEKLCHKIQSIYATQAQRYMPKNVTDLQKLCGMPAKQKENIPDGSEALAPPQKKGKPAEPASSAHPQGLFPVLNITMEEILAMGRDEINPGANLYV